MEKILRVQLVPYTHKERSSLSKHPGIFRNPTCNGKRKGMRVFGYSQRDLPKALRALAHVRWTLPARLVLNYR